MMDDIYNRYISQSAPEQVNIPATMRVRIEQRMNADVDGRYVRIQLLLLSEHMLLIEKYIFLF
jgi:hypothetical protein